MEIIEIPPTVLFEGMLKKIGLPSPTYRARMTEEGKLVASVKFYPATRLLRFSYGTVSLSGHPMDNLDTAYNDAAKEAIGYMEHNEHKILKDYSYEKLNEKKQTEECHINRIIENNRRTSKIIKEKDQKIKQITKYWDNFITSVADTNDKITQIAEDGYSVGTTQLDNDINATLWEVQKGTTHLDQLTFEATDILQKVGKYPYDTDTDTSEADQFPPYSPSPSPSAVQDSENSYDDANVYDSYGLCAMDRFYL